MAVTERWIRVENCDHRCPHRYDGQYTWGGRDVGIASYTCTRCGGSWTQLPAGAWVSNVQDLPLEKRNGSVERMECGSYGRDPRWADGRLIAFLAVCVLNIFAAIGLVAVLRWWIR